MEKIKIQYTLFLLIIIGLMIAIWYNDIYLKNKSKAKTPKIEEKLLIDDLIEKEDYKKIETNKEINNIYESLKNHIYLSDRDNVNSFQERELFEIISYNVKKEDIKNVKEEDNYTYGYVEKILLKKQIENVFGKDSVLIEKKSEKETKATTSYGKMVNAGDKFQNAILIKETGEDYYFRFYRREGTGACPILENIPIKLVEIRKIDNYLLLISKAVYSDCSNVNSNIATIKVFNNLEKEEVLDIMNIPVGTAYQIDVSKYEENASNIYLVLKMDEKGKYHFYKSKINN